jgi:hypothetical protein
MAAVAITASSSPFTVSTQPQDLTPSARTQFGRLVNTRGNPIVIHVIED